MNPEQFAHFGEHTLIYLKVLGVYSYFASCGMPITFAVDEQAAKVKTDIEFHLITCEKCNS